MQIPANTITLWMAALSNIATKIMIKFAFAFLFVAGVVALPPNFEDVDLAADQPDGEVGIEMVLVENLSPPLAGG